MEYGKEYDELFELKVKYFDEDMSTGTLVYDSCDEFDIGKILDDKACETGRILKIILYNKSLWGVPSEDFWHLPSEEINRLKAIIKHKEYGNKMKEFLDTYYERLIFRFNSDKDLIIDLIAENLYRDKKTPLLTTEKGFCEGRYEMIYPYAVPAGYVDIVQKILNRIIEYNDTVMITYKFSPKLADVKITFG